MEHSQELAIPTSEFIAPESDGSLGVIVKEGLYTWKVHKRFTTTGGDLWIPIRAERQEVSFVPNRVNECNQCHQDRNQDKIDEYHGYYSIAHNKMRGDLSDLWGTQKDISEYNATKNIPDFHKQIVPLLTKAGLNSDKSCVDCHNSTDKLDPSNSTVTSDYIVPKPISTLPKAYLFFTDSDNGMLKKLDTNGTVVNIGNIDEYSTNWTTMYRRADKGWLYFFNQEEQKVYVVSETNASLLFNITIDNEPNRVGTMHKQTLYLLWWRPAEGNVGDANYTAGGLEGLLESKLSSDPDKNGDFYVKLGSGENNETTIIPKWTTKLPDGGNTIGVYVWRRATFMTKWVNEGIDRMNVLNLVTGKTKYMTDFNFTTRSVDGVDYNASDYWNVRAIVVAKDGAFYGFNKDLNSPPVAFNFDPILGIQEKVTVPTWLQDYINNYNSYATPFLVIEPRD
jgi:hypothetical protein